MSVAKRLRNTSLCLLLLLAASLSAGLPPCAADPSLVVTSYPQLAVIRVEPDDIFNPGTTKIQPVNVGLVFYPFFPDDYDFLVAYPFFAHDDDHYSYYVRAQNHVQGIGLEERDISSWFGSDGKLLGVAMVHGSTYPSLVLHEIGHQWSAYAEFCEDDMSHSDALYELWPYAPYHWQLTNQGWGVMGGRGWSDNGDGTWTNTTPPDDREFLPISLYMMGMISAADMPVIPTLELDQPAGWMTDTIKAHERIIPTERIICAEGERIPSVADSQKHFRAAFVVLVMDDDLTGLSGVESARSQVPDEWARATGYRSTIDTRLLPNRAPANGTVTPLSGTGAVSVTTAFTTTWTDANGWEDLKHAYFHIGASPAIAGNVTLLYNAAKHKLWLRSDDGGAWTGGFAPGSATVLENSQAIVHCDQTAALGAGDTLSVTWAIEFKPGYTGAKKLGLKCKDLQKAKAKGQWKGSWTIE
jgi:hypothetical protein